MDLKQTRTNIILALIGSTIGLVAVYCAKLILLPKREGTEFKSVEDFRSALNDSRANGRYRRPDGSLPFAAVINSHPSDDIIYTLKPNLNDNFTGVNVKTNSFGMRSPERPIIKPSVTFRIALMGDSFAFGWGVDIKSGFAQVIEDLLNQDLNGSPKVEVLNFGIPGYSTFQEVALFQERALQFEPDAVLVFLVDNDFDFPFFIKDSSKESGLVQSFSLSRIDRSNAPLLNAQKAAMKDKGPVKSLTRLIQLTDPLHIPVYLAVNPRRDWRNIMKKLSKLHETSLHFLEFGAEFEEIVKKNGYTDKDLNLPKDPHPTALRHSIYGKLIAQELVETIQQ